jgi:hypothetical protein
MKSPKDSVSPTPAEKEALIAQCPKAMKSMFRIMEATCAGLTACAIVPDDDMPELAEFEVEPAVMNKIKVGDTWFSAICLVANFDNQSRLTIIVYATQVTKMGKESFDATEGTVYSAYTGEFEQVAKAWLKLQTAARAHCKKAGLSYSVFF